MGWLYMLIALCLMFSGVMAWGLMQKLHDQQVSADTYQALSSEAVFTGQTVFPDETASPVPATVESEGEAEDQSDTVFFINHDVVEAPANAYSTEAPTDAATVGFTATATDANIAATAATATNYAGVTPATVTLPTPAGLATPTPKPGAGWNLVTPKPSATPGGGWSLITPQPGATPTVTAAQNAGIHTLLANEPRQARTVTMTDVHYTVDFPFLQTINADVKAWLIQDGTPINYPVLQAKNNDYYLTRMFNRKLNQDGSIFLDSGSNALFIDANTYIYGHHTKTDAMFSTLKLYQEQAYYEAHPQMVLLTPYGDFAVDLFASRVCLVNDETTWRVKQFTRKAEFTAYMAELTAQSAIRARADTLPEWGDQLLVLVTCTNEHHGERYVVYGRMRQIVYGDTEGVAITKVQMDEQPTLTATQNVPGRGEMTVYAQNDPLWSSLRYESLASAKRRSFGAGGCGPTSVAMAVVNLVPKERLGDIFGYAKSSRGFSFCSCSVNQYFCNKQHAQYLIQTEAEYLRYYPLVMAGFATGNNYWQQVSRGSGTGTSLNFLKKIAYLYKLELSVTDDESAMLQAVQSGALAVVSLGKANPLTNTGHYAVLASADDTYLYLLDPFRKDSYKDTDRGGILTAIAPGVVRVARVDMGKLAISTAYLLNATAQTDSPEPPAVQQP